jgi:hypothetical protein
MTKYTTRIADLLSPLSRSVFEKAVRDYKTDKWSKTLSTWNLFKTMVFGQLIGAFSVREIVGALSANAKKLYHAGLKPVKRSTFCDAMGNRTHLAFKEILNTVIETAQALSGRMKKKFQDPLRIIDSTVIPVCLQKMPRARFRKAKGAVKIHTLLDGDNFFPLDAGITNGKVHDVKAMPWLCCEEKVIYAMDRGFINYNSLYDIELRGSKFVTRAKSNAAFKRIKNLKHDKDGPVISDVIIELTGSAMRKAYRKPLRKVKYRDDETKRIYEFLTNDFESPAQTIADIYKERWQIELFFKFLKQNLKVKTFWGTSKNAVFMQIWVAFIVSILLWIKKTLDGIVDSIHQILQKLKTTLLSKGSLLELCSDTPPPFIMPDLQPALEGLW